MDSGTIHLFPDFADLLAAFAACKVEYVLLGGYAVVFHGRPRATKDLDILVGLTDENRERLASALEAFGAPPAIVDAHDTSLLTKSCTSVQARQPPSSSFVDSSRMGVDRRAPTD